MPIFEMPKNGAYVYHLISNGEIVYVGKSVNPLGRIGCHFNDKNFDSYELFECESVELSEVLEAERIVELQPPLNKTFNKCAVGLLTKKEAVDFVKSKSRIAHHGSTIWRNINSGKVKTALVYGNQYVYEESLYENIEEILK